MLGVKDSTAEEQIKKSPEKCLGSDKSTTKLTESATAMLEDRYLLSGEDIDGMFERIANQYGENKDHVDRLRNYMRKSWFIPATPILSNGGTNRGLPISCFVNEADDSLEGIVNMWNESIWMAARGGGIGSYWGNLRSIGESVSRRGATSGVIPFIVVQNALTLAISQGSLRRGSSAAYLPIEHPEIEEFIDIRRPTGGDSNRKALNLHNAVIISDAFMQAVENDADWSLISPKTGQEIRSVKARSLWIRILTTRIETGEPYILFGDSVNNMRPETYKKLGLLVKTSNLCSEIMLHTGKDHKQQERSGVCCLSSVNLEHFDDWKGDELFIEDVMRFLDNVLQDFIDNAPNSMESARYSAMRERSVGLGFMGLHSMFQKKMIPFESVVAKIINKNVTKHIKERADAASIKIAQEKGACPDSIEIGGQERFSHKLAIAPTASISVIAGNVSPGAEPYLANAFTSKTLSGSFAIRNKYLEKILEEKGENNRAVWSSIVSNEGSVAHLDFLSDLEKDVFKTAYEIDQRHIIDMAADRTPFVCQGQSINLFLPANSSKKILHSLHFSAWKKGLKSLYYCRSRSIQRSLRINNNDNNTKPNDTRDDNYEECLHCQ